MKIIKKGWLKNSPGFTLAELMVAMTVGSFVMGGVFAIMTQLFWVTADNSNYMAAFRQVQNAGAWISHDALVVQQVYEMASTELDEEIGETTDEIRVGSTDGFPPAGVICIEDELIQYTSKTENTFEDCTRGDNATAHDDGQPVTFFITMNWTDWPGNQHQVAYTLEDTSGELKQLKRSHYIWNEVDGEFDLQDSTLVAQVIDPANTSSSWDEVDKELTVVITAKVGDYVLLRHGKRAEPATRTYKVHPRPLS